MCILRHVLDRLQVETNNYLIALLLMTSNFRMPIANNKITITDTLIAIPNRIYYVIGRPKYLDNCRKKQAIRVYNFYVLNIQ